MGPTGGEKCESWWLLGGGGIVPPWAGPHLAMSEGTWARGCLVGERVKQVATGPGAVGAGNGVTPCVVGRWQWRGQHGGHTGVWD